MKTFIGFKKALDLTLANVHKGPSETLPLSRLTGRILSENIKVINVPVRLIQKFTSLVEIGPFIIQGFNFVSIDPDQHPDK